MAKAKAPKKKQRDLVVVHSPTDDGTGVNVLRAKEDRVEVGTMQPLQEGKPLAGEVVKLSRRKEHPMLFDAETLVEAPASSASRSDAAPRPNAGPAQVASDDYRKNWDAIYKRRGTKKRELLN